MTLLQLIAKIGPTCEDFANELAIEVAEFPSDHGTCVTCRPAHDAASLLCHAMHAIEQAADGQPELLRALTARLECPLSISELVGPR